MVVGMVAVLAPIIVISGSATATAPAKGNYVPQTRTYFIGADEVDWNYAPTGSDQITGEPFDETAAVFTQQGPQRIGSTYIKSLYREYTDSSFRTLKPRTAADEHLGMLGPVIRAVVGDTIKVVFKNNLDRPGSRAYPRRLL